MDFDTLVVETRAVRRFDASRKIGKETLVSFVDNARKSPASRNIQCKKYIVVTDEEACAKVFSALAWAGYLADWAGPEKDEQPVGYILILNDKTIIASSDVDTGLVAESIVLNARTQGIGACMLGAINRPLLMDALDIDPDRFKIDLVIALGYPKEFPVLVDVVDGDIKYYRDAEGNHYVPKRSLEEVLVKTF